MVTASMQEKTFVEGLSTPSKRSAHRSKSLGQRLREGVSSQIQAPLFRRAAYAFRKKAGVKRKHRSVLTDEGCHFLRIGALLDFRKNSNLVPGGSTRKPEVIESPVGKSAALVDVRWD